MKRNKKGFTIVELVIVIGVIGILSAILIPTFVSLNDQAQNAQLQSNLHNAYTMYVADAVDGKKDGETNVYLEYYAQDKVAMARDSAQYKFNGTEWIAINADELATYTAVAYEIPNPGTKEYKPAKSEYNKYTVYFKA